MTRVIDASVVVAALVDTGRAGTWAEQELLTDHLAAPHLLPFEVSNILRRLVLSGELSAESAALARAHLVQPARVTHPWARRPRSAAALRSLR